MRINRFITISLCCLLLMTSIFPTDYAFATEANGNIEHIGTADNPDPTEAYPTPSVTPVGDLETDITPEVGPSQTPEYGDEPAPTSYPWVIGVVTPSPPPAEPWQDYEYSLEYSALTYMNKAKEKDDVTLKNLANAMYGYFTASKRYFDLILDDDEMDII